MSISSLNSLFNLNNILPSSGDNGVENNLGTNSFSNMVKQKLEEVSSLQKEADQLTESFLAGEQVEVHQMLIAMEKVDLAIRELVEIKNKMVEAYRQITNMQI